MSKVYYLDERLLTEINFRLIDIYSPKEDKRVRDMSALNMIVNLPRQFAFGKELYPTIYDKAAIIFIKLILKHPFENANKRTATMALLMFLEINHCSTKIDKNELENLSVQVTKDSFTDELFEKVKNTITVA